jgi:hypothetical protein
VRPDEAKFCLFVNIYPNVCNKELNFVSFYKKRLFFRAGINIVRGFFETISGHADFLLRKSSENFGLEKVETYDSDTG